MPNAQVASVQNTSAGTVQAAAGDGSCMPLLAFDHVWFRYPGATGENEWALRDVTFSVEAGTRTVLVGENGSGKSTLTKLACGLLLPHRGTVYVDGRDTCADGGALAARQRCGYMFQNPEDQLVENRVVDEVAFGPANLGLDADEIARRVRKALSLTGLDGFEERQTATLSGGQKQRLALAGALAMEPAALILDEAASMLDPQSRDKLLALLEDLRARGITTLSATHFMDEALAAQTVVALEHGRVAYAGAPEGLFDDTMLLERLGLEAPLPVQMRALLARHGMALPFCASNAQLAAALAQAQRNAMANGNGVGTNLSASIAAKAGEACQGGDQPDQSTPLCTFSHAAFSYAQPARKRTKRRRRSQDEADTEAAPFLHDVSFALPRGGLVGLAGATGTGKSTVLKALAGLLPLQDGQLTWAGGTPARVGLLFQYPERQLFAQTVRDDVAFGPRNLGRTAAQVEEDTVWALELAQVPEALWERNPFSLSGGEQRRAALAGVLALRPQLLALDEPTAGQDPRHRIQLMALIERLRTEGLTVLLATHDMELLRQTDWAVILGEGTVALQDAPEKILADPATLAQRGLTAPAAIQLVAEANRCGLNIPAAAAFNTPALLADALFRAATA